MEKNYKIVILYIHKGGLFLKKVFEMRNLKKYQYLIREKNRIYRVTTVNKNHNIEQKIYWSIICKYLDLDSLRTMRLTCNSLCGISFHTVKERFGRHPSEVIFPDNEFGKLERGREKWTRKWKWNPEYRWVCAFNQENIKRIKSPQIIKGVNDRPNYGRKKQLSR